MEKRIAVLLKKVKLGVPKRLRWRLPFFYLIGLILGLILTSLYIKFPSLVVCSKLFGQEFCTPTGIFLALIISLPGYFIVGNLLPFLVSASWFISFIPVILASFFFYYLIGVLLEKYNKAAYENKIKILVFSAFFILFVLLVFLVL